VVNWKLESSLPLVFLWASHFVLNKTISIRGKVALSSARPTVDDFANAGKINSLLSTGLLHGNSNGWLYSG
jgi:hypothetical protein